MIDAVHIHLTLNHVPVLFTPLGFVLLLIGLLRKNTTLIVTALGLFIVASVMAIPVYLTGEPAEELVESIAGVQENIIERHEDFSKLGLIGSSIVGLLSGFLLILYRYTSNFNLKAGILILIFSMVSSGLLMQTAYLGGQIRHSELYSSGKSGPMSKFDSSTDKIKHEPEYEEDKLED